MISNIVFSILIFSLSSTVALEAWGGVKRGTCGGSGSYKTAKKLSKKEAAELKAQGAEVYEEYGDAWHAVRYRNEFTAAQWKTILLQKRIRVPLTAEDQRALSELFVGE
jgi:hypothetical protein